jgi:YbbR domain-containing protein
LHHLPVQVNSGAAQVRVLSVDPPRLDIELAPVISRTVPVTIDLPEHQSLSPAYTMISAPVAAPQEVQVVGPAPWVEQVSQVQATISLAKASTSLRELRPLKALNEKGHEVTGVNLQPSQAQVNVAIRRRVDARDVGIRVVTTGTPPPGYWLSGLSVTPAGVTLQGNPDLLAEVGSFVDTLPVDVSEAAGDLNIAIPLDLPPDLQALDSEGNSVRNVKVLVQITARQGDLVVSRPVELVNLKPGVVATVDPPEVELLLSGPLPTLSQIEMNKQLVRVLVDATDSAPDQNADVEPTIMAPDGIKVQMAPSSVSVTYHNQPTAER